MSLKLRINHQKLKYDYECVLLPIKGIIIFYQRGHQEYFIGI